MVILILYLHSNKWKAKCIMDKLVPFKPDFFFQFMQPQSFNDNQN